MLLARAADSRTLITCLAGILISAACIALLFRSDRAFAGFAVTCGFRQSTDTLEVTGSPVIRRSGDEVKVLAFGIEDELVPVDCSELEPPHQPFTPTVNNIDAIKVTPNASRRRSTLILDLDEGLLSPGKTTEGSEASSEIEVDYETGSHHSYLDIHAPSLGDFKLGTSADGTQTGIELNADVESGPEQDADVTAAELPTLFMYGSGEGMFVNARGWPPYPAPLQSGFLFIFGSAGDDVLIAGRDEYTQLHGSGGDDILRGTPGRDELDGGVGNDEMHGFRGYDFLEPGSGSDLMYGGRGEDQFVCGFYGGTGVTVDLRDRGLQPTAPDGPDTLRGIQDVSGCGGPDLIIGDDEPNYLRGGSGPDELIGHGGDDLIYGDGFISGYGARDTLSGGGGGDQLDGGEGGDALLGGFGIDLLHARDHTRDLRLNCGPGDNRLEKAFRDPQDPAARRC
jgi:hypothetical protein